MLVEAERRGVLEAVIPIVAGLAIPDVRERPFLGRLSGRGSTIPLEKLLALEPDLILDTGTVDATYLSAAENVHERTGIPYLLVPGRLAAVRPPSTTLAEASSNPGESSGICGLGTGCPPF